MSVSQDVPVGQDESKVPAGQTQDPAGGEQDKESGLVSRDSYLKVLAERKRDAERRRSAEEELQKYRDKERNELEQQAQEKGEFDKVIGTYKEQVNTLASQVDNYKKMDVNRAKVGAFLSQLPGELGNDEYLAFVDLESIGYDPDTKMVDELSVQQAAKKFVDAHPQLIRRQNGPKLPGAQAVGGQGIKPKSLKSMSDAELKALFLSGKFKE